jgi:predicted transcriptional regulator
VNQDTGGVMGIAEDIVKDAFEYYNEEYYKRLREGYPAYAKEWIEEKELKKRIGVDVIKLKESGMSARKIAEKLNAPYKTVLKLVGELHGKYTYIKRSNKEKLLEAAGDIRTPQQLDDYKYINDPRTIKNEMLSLLPQLDNIKGLTE